MRQYEDELAKARRMVAAAELGKASVEQARKIIEEIYGLKTEIGEWYAENEPPAVLIHVLTPTNIVISQIELYWDEDGYIIPERTQRAVEEVRVALRKLRPRKTTASELDKARCLVAAADQHKAPSSDRPDSR
jgi:hypothetical protein